ncbi:hypothetical protein Droror1_Dr00022642 [Drosera rotundifolia]
MKKLSAVRRWRLIDMACLLGKHLSSAVSSSTRKGEALLGDGGSSAWRVSPASQTLP